MRLKYLASCLPALSFALPLAAQAQDAAPTIVVTGRGLQQTPATPAYDVVEIDRGQLTSSASGRLEDVLSSIAGFQQFRRSDSRSSNPSAQGVTLRALGGNATSRALVLLDGVPLADPFFGYIPLSAAAPERLGSIRVTRGGGSGPFGAGALAGTIELESADATSLGLISGQALIDDRAETELSGAFAPQVGDGFAEISGRWDHGQGFWTTPVDQRIPASVRARYQSWSTSTRLVEPIGEGLELQLRGLAFDDERTLRFAGADSTSHGKDVSARLVSRGQWQVDALAYGQWRNFTNVVISSSTFNRTLDQRDTPSTGVGGKFELRPPVGGGHTFRLGSDFRRSSGDLAEDRYNASTGAANGQRFAGGRNSDLGLFVEDDWSLGPITLTGGVRADRWSLTNGYHLNLSAAGAVLADDHYSDRNGWDFSWRTGALANVGSGFKLRAAAYTGLRMPTLNELYRPFVVFPVTTSANAALENERLEGYEAGIDWQSAVGARLSLTAFDNKVKNAIANVTLRPDLCAAAPSTPGNCDRQRQNLDAIDAQGVELAGLVQQGPFSLDASLAYTDAKARGSGPAAQLDGNRPAQTPAWSASATLSYRPADGTVLAATLRHVAKQFEGDLEDGTLPAATTLDLYAQLPLVGALSLVGRVENLFDETIITRNQGGSMDLGAPRTVWSGLRYGF
jgi:vitamin B12 transporter